MCLKYKYLQDFRATDVYAIDFLIDNTSLGFLVSDKEKNLVLYMYQPEARESFGGNVNYLLLILYTIPFTVANYECKGLILIFLKNDI